MIYWRHPSNNNGWLGLQRVLLLSMGEVYKLEKVPFSFLSNYSLQKVNLDTYSLNRKGQLGIEFEHTKKTEAILVETALSPPKHYRKLKLWIGVKI